MSKQTFSEQAQALDATQYTSFLRAIEIGKWPDGNPVSAAQRELMLQAVILYENKNIAAEMRSGFLPDACASKNTESNGDNSVRASTQDGLIASSDSSSKSD